MYARTCIDTEGVQVYRYINIPVHRYQPCMCVRVQVRMCVYV